MDALKTIACLLYPNVMSLDLSGPLQVFASANDERQRQGLPPFYRLLVLAEQPGAVATSAGFQLVAEQAWGETDPAQIDTLLIPGGQGEQAQCQNSQLLAWLGDAAPQVRRLGSVCSGALILAAAGLLDGRRATAHWSVADDFAQRFAAVQVDREVLYVDEGDVVTSAGTAAGMDCCLHILRRLRGAEAANRAARHLVIAPHRAGGQAQRLARCQ